MTRLETPHPSGPLHAARTQAIFFSDGHLCSEDTAADRTREERLVRFLETIDPERSTLYIVGDLFDFWFTYKRCIPRRGFRVLAQLLLLRRAGLPITFVAGNHDYWAIPFLRDDLGVETSDQPIARTILGHSVWMAHGDGLGSGDGGYKLLKAVLRNRLAIALYSLIHPDLGIALATGTSRVSRAYEGDDVAAHGERVLSEVARPRFEAGHDLVVLGHIHAPIVREDGRHTMVLLGDWLSNFTYLTLTRDRLELKSFGEDGRTEVRAARALEPRSDGEDPVESILKSGR